MVPAAGSAADHEMSQGRSQYRRCRAPRGVWEKALRTEGDLTMKFVRVLYVGYTGRPDHLEIAQRNTAALRDSPAMKAFDWIIVTRPHRLDRYWNEATYTMKQPYWIARQIVREMPHLRLVLGTEAYPRYWRTGV